MPSSIPPRIVDDERDMPGHRAKHWNGPTIRASCQRKASSPARRMGRGQRSATKIHTAPAANPTATVSGLGQEVRQQRRQQRPARDERVLSADVRVAKRSARRGGERPVTGGSGACGGTRGTPGRGGCGRGQRAGRLARRSATTRCLGGRVFGEQWGGITGPTVGCRRWPGGPGR